MSHKHHQNKKCCADSSSSSSTCTTSNSSSECCHEFKTLACKTKENGQTCCLKKCCKCGFTEKVCVQRPGPVGPTGPPGQICAGVGFGNGFDQSVNLCNPATAVEQKLLTQGLDRDYYFENLTLCAGVNLRSNGFRIFVRNTLDFGDGGVISNNGGNASAASAGVGGRDGTLGGGSPGSYNGQAAAASQYNPIGGAGGSASAINPGVPLTFIPTVNGGPRLPVGANDPLAPFLFVFPQNTTGRDLAGAKFQGGTGSSSSVGTASGGAGGIVMISAFKIRGSGRIEAKGGQPFAFSQNSVGGSAGGAIILNYVTKAANSIIDLDVSGTNGLNGGTAGTGGLQNIYIVPIC